MMSLPLYLQIVKGATPTESGLHDPADDLRHPRRRRWAAGMLISKTGPVQGVPDRRAWRSMVVVDVPVRADRDGHAAVADHADHGVGRVSGSACACRR